MLVRQFIGKMFVRQFLGGVFVRQFQERVFVRDSFREEYFFASSRNYEMEMSAQALNVSWGPHPIPSVPSLHVPQLLPEGVEETQANINFMWAFFKIYFIFRNSLETYVAVGFFVPLLLSITFLKLKEFKKKYWNFKKDT